MGHSSSTPLNVGHTRLIFSNNSLRNNTINCDALGIHYELSTPTNGLKLNRVTSVSRWDAHLQRSVLVTEWERKTFGKDRIRIASGRQIYRGGSDAGFVSVEEFFPRTSGFFSGGSRFNRSFTASNGKHYTWKARSRSLKLYCREDGKVPVAMFSRRRYIFNPHRAYIQLSAGCEDILDYIIVTCVIAERKRREAKKRQSQSASISASSN